MAQVAIIVPVYNVEKYVEKCVRSCENQDIPMPAAGNTGLLNVGGEYYKFVDSDAFSNDLKVYSSLKVTLERLS